MFEIHRLWIRASHPPMWCGVVKTKLGSWWKEVQFSFDQRNNKKKHETETLHWIHPFKTLIYILFYFQTIYTCHTRTNIYCEKHQDVDCYLFIIYFVFSVAIDNHKYSGFAARLCFFVLLLNFFFLVFSLFNFLC